VTVDVREVGALLVDHGTWVHTRLAGVVQAVLRSSQENTMVRGRVLDIQLDGGELSIGKVVVKVGIPLLLPSHRSYLLFLRANRDTGVLSPTHTPLLIEKGKLVGPRQAESRIEGPPDPLQGLTLKEVIADVQDVTR
jgi:hypothetical protein